MQQDTGTGHCSQSGDHTGFCVSEAIGEWIEKRAWKRAVRGQRRLRASRLENGCMPGCAATNLSTHPGLVRA